MLKTRFHAALLSYFRSVALGGRGLTNEKKKLNLVLKLSKVA